MTRKGTPFLGFGCGLRHLHYDYLLTHPTQVDWFEIISENYMMAGGKPLAVLEKLREEYPVVMHGVSLSIGSTDPLNFDYLKKLKALARRVQPAWISDHLCWTSFGGHNAHDLLPLPYTEEALHHAAGRIRQVQDFLGERMALENVSSYIEYQHSEMPEWEFLRAVSAEADCGILLDVNNIYVSSFNHHFDPWTYLQNIPADRVWQYHLAGHSHCGDYLLDTHDHPIIQKVWELYQKTLQIVGLKTTLIEWDDKIPPFEVLEQEVIRARKYAESVATNFLGTDRRTPRGRRGTPEFPANRSGSMV